MSRPVQRAIMICRTMVALAVICLLLHTSAGCAAQHAVTSDPQRLTGRSDEFLEDLSRRLFTFFWEQADPGTGLVRDRAGRNGPALDPRNVASIAATGFGLTALCIGSERGWISKEDARARVRTTLRFFAERAVNVHGWFYHWMDATTGARAWQSEISSIDTALLLGGILTARQYFKDDPEVVTWATTIYERVDFPWMLNGDPKLLSHGWTPESGFITFRWNTYSELMILYLLAIGAPAHSITPDAWYAWVRNPLTYSGYTYIEGVPPLFIHQYAHAWIDFRDRRDGNPSNIDWFKNSVDATRAHKAFCLRLASQYPGYTENIWGITASDSPKGYVAWGGPPRDLRIDGTVVPAAPGGSLMFAPDICVPALEAMRDQYGDRIYGRYGFSDAFNPNTGWVGPDVIGISVGVTLLSAENLRSGNVRKWFMANPEPGKAMALIGFVPVQP